MEGIIAEKHDISINDRTHINMTGIRKIISFDPEEFLLDSSLGTILLKGSKLEIVKLNTTDGDLSIKGKLDSICYIEGKQKNSSEGFISKLFK